MAGHSKWAQIKHEKAAADQKKGARFSKLAREITVAAREGGPDPASNARLRAAIERARVESLPKETIERAIERAASRVNGGVLTDFLYGALGSENAQILITGITDNTNRALSIIRKILAEHGAKLTDPGSIVWNFEKRGVFVVPRRGSAGQTEDEIELALIDAGAREITRGAGVLLVETPVEETERVRARARAHGLQVEPPAIVYRAKSRVVLSPAASRALKALTNALEKADDVQAVYTNEEWTEAL